MEKVQLQGLCFDAKSSFMRGPAKAPAKIREALASPSANRYTESLVAIADTMILDRGDQYPETLPEIARFTENHLKTALPLISLGGDHSVTYPLVQAFHKVYGPLEILHFDAHADLYEDFEGDPYSHACPFARILEEGLCAQLTQVGLRTLTPQQKALADKHGVEQFTMQQLPARFELSGKPLYISLDLDVLDPAFAPGVSHHEPGGMSSRELLALLHAIPGKIVGADLVELNPDRDIDGRSAMVAGKLLKELIALCL